MKHLLVFISILLIQLRSFAQDATTIAYIDFDNPPQNFEVIYDSSVSNLWQIGTPQKPFFGNAFSVPHAMLTDTINPYPVSNHSSVILKFANNYAYTEDWTVTSISFWHKFQMDSLHDFGHLYWSYDDSDIWLPMTDTCCVPAPGYLGNWEWFSWENQLLYTSHRNFVTGMQDWTYSTYAWRWYLPVAMRDDPFFPDTMYIRFDFDSDSLTETNDGWMIDDVIVNKALYSGIDEPENFSLLLSTYPNPASSKFYFALNGQERANHAYLFNCIGKQMRSAAMNSNQSNFAVDDLPRGVYLLRVETMNGKSATVEITLE